MLLRRLSLTAILLTALSCVSAHASTPTIGQPAPALTFTNLLQAPDGAKADWPSLRGKVVVLEFWATWCSGCIIEIPHLNDLVQSVDPNKVQFIAVDDEDPAIVKKFLAKTPIHGWLGFDTSAKIIDAYDAKVRPRTVVVDAQGIVAGILSPTQLTKEQLIALADGKPVVFPTDETEDIRKLAMKDANAAADANATGTDGPKPLFDISIRPGKPAERFTLVHRPSKTDDSYIQDILNASLPMLLQFAGGVQGSRLVVHGDKGEKYSLHVSAPGGDFKDLAPAIQLAIITTTGMKLSHVTKEEDAYVLQATPKAASLLTPAASDQMSYCYYQPRDGKMMMMNSTLDSLASSLENAIGQPVVNEAGFAGQFSATFDLPKNDVDAAKAALEKNLGLTLVKAKRKIERVVLDPLPVPEKTAEKAAPVL
jgi:uncharacterized protein (TIGR03435 family)